MHDDDVGTCLSKWARELGLEGQVTVSFTVEATGVVSEAGLEPHPATTIWNRGLESCLSEAIKTWSFPKPRGGGKVFVSYPFILHQRLGGDSKVAPATGSDGGA